MSTIRTSNNSKMLIWAREEVGYTLEQAAEAIGVSVETLQAAESGEKPLTLNQLRKAAEKFDFPFGYFYLSKPPREKTYTPMPDFRIEPGLAGADHYRLNLEIKKCRDRREVFIDLAIRLDVPIKLFQLLPVAELEKNIGSIVRKRLGILDAEIDALTYDEAYAFWKEKIENDGVLVYESQYIPDASGVIGAAIFYESCPIILLKRGGYFNERRLFTLLHEYAHLLIGQSAINDARAQIIDAINSPETQLEVSCNRIAAEILVPSEKINFADYQGMNLVEKMEALSKIFKVTYSTAAVCLKRINLINQQELAHLLELRKNANERTHTTQKVEVKIPREILMRIDLGRPMFNTVLEAYSTGLLNVFDASNILNLRVKKIDRLLSNMR
ncbi:MAG: helix-turn-helix domain-containing protein [Nitrosomonadales bacterium]|nr:helix-turn-helix domain-containing protein [Nitrosomonadales bacterium]